MFGSVDTFVDSLVENVDKRNVPDEIDLVLDVGMFGGDYTLGALMYIKALERAKVLKVRRISGASIGSVLGMLYLTDELERVMDVTHKEIIPELRRCQSVNTFKELLRGVTSVDISQNVYRDLYVSYRDGKECKLVVKQGFDDYEDMLEIITRSCFVPWLTGDDMTHPGGYFDGLTPHLFRDKERPSLFVSANTKTLFASTLSIVNEKNLWHRLLHGVENTHSFFSKAHGKRSDICSYVGDWSAVDMVVFRGRDVLALIVYIMVMVRDWLNRNLPDGVKDNVIVSRGGEMIGKLFRDFVFLWMY